jgi:TadE-like protein
MPSLTHHGRIPRRQRCTKRRGVYTIELILVLIVLVLATFVSFQFGIALIVKQAVAHASTVAAREAAKANPADLAELEEIIETVLAGHGITIGSDASFVLENPDPQPQQGTLPCTPPASPVLDGDEVRVTVCVSLTAHPILNILEAYSIDFTGKTFSISSVATRE